MFTTVVGDGPVNAVFTTPELMELILLELSMKGIHEVQLVCHQFRMTIKSSKALQKKAFLSPIPEIKWNMRLAGNSLHFEKDKRTQDSSEEDGTRGVGSVPIIMQLNPLCDRQPTLERNLATFTAGEIINFNTILSFMPKILHSRPSFWHTFLTLPPVTRIKAKSVKWQANGWTEECDIHLKVSTGITIGDFLNEVLKSKYVAFDLKHAKSSTMMQILPDSGWTIQLCNVIFPTEKELQDVEMKGRTYPE